MTYGIKQCRSAEVKFSLSTWFWGHGIFAQREMSLTAAFLVADLIMIFKTNAHIWNTDPRIHCNYRFVLALTWIDLTLHNPIAAAAAMAAGGYIRGQIGVMSHFIQMLQHRDSGFTILCSRSLHVFSSVFIWKYFNMPSRNTFWSVHFCLVNRHLSKYWGEVLSYPMYCIPIGERDGPRKRDIRLE